jgi:hypothetical protein
MHQAYNYHLSAAYHIVKYLAGTSKYRLTFGNNGKYQPISNQLDITIYTDSDWAGERVDRKSTGGNITYINGIPINWQSKKQNIVALSSTEAELYALTEAVREALFIKQWFEYYVTNHFRIEIRCDNNGAILIADHSTNHNRTKHIDIRCFFIREHINEQLFKLNYVKSQQNVADLFTKSLETQVFHKFTNWIFNPLSISL